MDMCTISAQRLMVAPAMVAVIIPVAVGGFFWGRRVYPDCWQAIRLLGLCWLL